MALGNITTFTLDMVPGGAPPIIHVSAGDVGRLFTVNLTYNGTPYDIQGNNVKIRGTKPDNTVFEYPADDFDTGESWVDFLIEEQMAIVSGRVLCELREYLNDDQIGSANFILDVETAVYDPEAASESYIPSVEAAIADAVESVNASAEDAEDSADRAEAAAESMAAYNTDRTPYLLRQSGGGVETGDREYDTIVGGTVAWNQMSKKNIGVVNNSTKSYDASTGVMTVTPSSYTSNAVGLYNMTVPTFGIVGHKYLCAAEVNSDHEVDFRFGFTPIFSPSVPANSWTKIAGIVNYSSGSFTIYARVSMFNWADGSFGFRNVQCFDLTQMFGSTIADYIYSLEQATAGAGVAWFRQYFPEDYYEYNAGELLSVSGVSAHNMTGLNQWNEQWEVGGLNTTTGLNNDSQTDRIRSKDYIRVVPGRDYWFNSLSVNMVVLLYDSNKNFTGTSIYRSASQPGYIVPNGVSFCRFYMVAAYGTTYKNDICICFRGSREGEYEPHKVNSYPLDDSLTLRGLPKLDGSKLYYDGDTYESDGTVTRKYGVRAYQSGDESLADAITDGTNTVYKLTTPTTETADPFTNPQVVDQNGTEEYVTESIVPVGHDTRYRINLRDKLEPIFDVPTTDGTYTLTVTVSNGIATYSWESS